MRRLGFFSPRIRAQFRGIFNGLCAAALLFLFYNRVDVLRNPLLRNSSISPVRWRISGEFDSWLVHESVIRRKAVEISPSSLNSVNSSGVEDHLVGEKFCVGLLDHPGFSSRCEYLKAHHECSSEGLFDYLRFLFCDCQNLGVLGYGVLAVWLVALFYLLGNTAADYFCCSLEKLSRLLNLPPTVAGVTLLPLGNGAPDVFASIAAFVGADAGEVGLNSVLGGAVFVTTVVVGTVSLLVAEKRVQIDRKCFLRDVGFFVTAIFSLLFILIVGRVTVGGTAAFVMIYAAYAFVVAANEILRSHARRLKMDSLTPLLPVRGSVFDVEEDGIYNPLLDFVSNDENAPRLHPSLPQWMWASNVAIYSNHPVKGGPDSGSPPWGWSEEGEEGNRFSFSCSCSKVFAVMEFPLTAARRLTIPMVEDESWSKPYAVASASLAPLLLAFLWGGTLAYVVAAVTGSALGLLAYRCTATEEPPKRFLLVWVLGGFVMSVAWFYMVANELVSLLVAFGVVFGVDPSILGLTVLAWGNSMGDLVSNVALALNGADGVQIALSGCYAGPMFNVLIGLGVSLLLGAWKENPEAYVVPKDGSLFCTVGFLLVGLAWAVLVLLRGEMRPGRVLGFGLIGLYLLFLSVRVGSAMGWL